MRVTEAAGDLRRATSVVVQAREVEESLKPATLVVAEARRVRLVAAAEEANGRPAIAVRRAGALPHAALAVREGRRAAAAVVGDRAAAEEAPVAVAAAGVAAAVVAKL